MLPENSEGALAVPSTLHSRGAVCWALQRAKLPGRKEGWLGVLPEVLNKEAQSFEV
jgi:hypothetical protein